MLTWRVKYTCRDKLLVGRPKFSLLEPSTWLATRRTQHYTSRVETRYSRFPRNDTLCELRERFITESA